MDNSRLRNALTHLLDDMVGEGVLLSDIPRQKRDLYRFALRQGYVTATPVPGDVIVNTTGRRP